MMIDKLSQQHIAIVGGGVSGIAAAELALTLGASVTLLDSNDTEALRERLQRLATSQANIELVLGNKAETWQESVDLAVLSPGITADSRLGQLVKTWQCQVTSELAFGSRFCPWPKLAVTGTNGKTTTVEMLTHGLRQAGWRVAAAGNIGLPMAEVARKQPELDFLVVEVSSFQLENSAGFVPQAAALLNVSPDHLNRHGNMQAYLELKLALLKAVEADKTVVLQEELLQKKEVRKAVEGRKVVTFSGKQNSLADFWLEDDSLWRRNATGGKEKLLPGEELQVSGDHNRENILAALALAESVGCQNEKLLSAMKDFRLGAHRQEIVLEKNGILFVDDSKATNVESLQRALRHFGRPDGADVALIAGGVDKGCDLREVLPELRQYVRKAFLVGACQERLHASWGQVIPTQLCPDLENAVSEAMNCVADGGTVLLSPACASQDMFVDYAHRGACFVEAVRKMMAWKNNDENGQKSSCLTIKHDLS